MNKTLQYILIFAVCFAGAMLAGRLFKGDKEVPDTNKDTTSANTIDSSIYYELHPKDTTPEFRAFLAKMEAQKNLIHPKCKAHHHDVDICRYISDSFTYEYHKDWYDKYDSPDFNPHKDTFNIFDSSEYLVIINGGVRSNTKIQFASIQPKGNNLYLYTEDEIEKSDFNHLTNTEEALACDCYFMHFAKFIIKHPKAYHKIYLHDSLIWTNKN